MTYVRFTLLLSLLITVSFLREGYASTNLWLKNQPSITGRSVHLRSECPSPDPPTQKYGHVAFDSSQKAVLTSCVLRYKPVIKVGSSSPKTPPNKSLKNDEAVEREPQGEEGFISCCFSFTIRRDMHGIPSMIVGNFIKC